MSRFQEVALGDIFEAVNGRALFTRDYLDAHPGDYLVYSASLQKPFGYADSFDYDGHYLTWVMNGYGGRMQEVTGKFSANRDRGVLIPKEGIGSLDLTYVRFAAEPELVATAVGRRVDGMLNEYTKVYPEAAKEVVIQLPVAPSGAFDYQKMKEVGRRLRRVEQAQLALKAAREPLLEASFALEVAGPSVSLSLGDPKYFSLSIGKRVLRSEHSPEGIPAYSANVRIPFGRVSQSNLSDFSQASLLWGIDGNFDWNLIPAESEFATTDHCGRLQLKDKLLYPEYVYWYLQSTRGRYGFDRVYRAKLQNVKSDVVLEVPVDEAGAFSLERQKQLASCFRKQEETRGASLLAIDQVLNARMAVSL